eukprot:13321610-Heterocapsa_arctica.AAC.1
MNTCIVIRIATNVAHKVVVRSFVRDRIETASFDLRVCCLPCTLRGLERTPRKWDRPRAPFHAQSGNVPAKTVALRATCAN